MRWSRTVKISLAVLSMLVCLVLPVSASGAPPREFFGVMADGPMIEPGAQVDHAAEARLMRRSGVGTVRLAMYWDGIEPARGEFRWGPYDRQVATLARQRIRVFPVLVRAPAWATPDPASATVATPPRLADFQRFARTAVKRYGTGGSFWRQNPRLPRWPIRQWQIWNEPMLNGYWAGQPWASTYTQLLRSAYRTIKSADRRAQVVSAGLTGDLDDLVEELYRAGAKGSFDALGLHPYRPDVRIVIAALAECREVMRRHRDRSPIVASEVSFSSGLGRSTVNYGIERTEQGQRTALVDVMQRLVAQRRRLGLASMTWYTWMSRDDSGQYAWDYSGLRRMTPSGPVSKPALGGFSRVAR